MRCQCCKAAKFGHGFKHTGINSNLFLNKHFFNKKQKIMVTYSNGANGAFSGKVGSIIGSDWCSTLMDTMYIGLIVALGLAG